MNESEHTISKQQTFNTKSNYKDVHWKHLLNTKYPAIFTFICFASVFQVVEADMSKW